MNNGNFQIIHSKREQLKKVTFWDLVNFVFPIAKISNILQWLTRLLAFTDSLFNESERL